VADHRQQIVKEFDEVVNMTPKELEEWLQTQESRSVGQSDGGGESKGHKSGRRIVEIKRKKKTDYTDDRIVAKLQTRVNSDFVLSLRERCRPLRIGEVLSVVFN
jgi:hypothetical protein